MVRLEGVSKRYGALQALRPTTFSFRTGGTTVLIGPSGCGKSTLLRIMVHLIRPDSGTVTLDGQLLGPSNLLALRRRVGYVIQDGGLFPHLTARQNATLMARHLRWPGKRTAARLSELAALSRFPEDGLDRYPLQLSGGQRQRVSLIRALMLDPDILLLDEPLGALDPMIRRDLQRDLRHIFRKLGKTVIMVTHDLGEAAYFGDEIVLMREGRIVQAGRLQDLATRPAEAFVTRFVRAQRSPLEGIEGGRP